MKAFWRERGSALRELLEEAEAPTPRFRYVFR